LQQDPQTTGNDLRHDDAESAHDVRQAKRAWLLPAGATSDVRLACWIRAQSALLDHTTISLPNYIACILMRRFRLLRLCHNSLRSIALTSLSLPRTPPQLAVAYAPARPRVPPVGHRR
jgi:hypothetical protein